MQKEHVSEVYIVNQENPPWWERQTNFEIRVGRLTFLSILYCFVKLRFNYMLIDHSACFAIQLTSMMTIK